MRSIATVKSSSVTASPLRRVATIAASLTRFARSAPVKPGELMLSLLGLLGLPIIRSLALLVLSVLKSEKSQEAPNRRGLCAGGLLVEHAAFARQCQCTIIREDGQSFKALYSQLRRSLRRRSGYGAQLPAI
jgi:hypothetical protein